MPRVTVQIFPAIAHPANASGLIVADDVVCCEHLAGGYTFTDKETVSALTFRFGRQPSVGKLPCFRVGSTD